MQLENFWSIIFCEGFNIKKEEDRFKFVWHSQKKNSELYGTELVPFSSRSLALQVVNFWKWKHQYLRENIALFHSNDDLFTQYQFLNKERCHLMTFSWRLESERKKEPQIPRLCAFRNYLTPCVMTMWCVFTGLTGLILWKQPYILLHCNSINSGVRMPRFSFHYYHNSGRQSDHLPL